MSTLAITPYEKKFYSKIEQNKGRYILTCDCGTAVSKDARTLKHNWQEYSCGPCTSRNAKIDRLNLLINTRKNNLKILEILGTDSAYKTVMKMQCYCGNTFNTRQNNISGINPSVRSCGCLKKKELGNRSSIDFISLARNQLFSQLVGGAKVRNIPVEIDKFKAFEIMQQQCFYCKNPHYSQYVRKTTKHAGMVFKHNGIDRVDNTAGYTVDNCVACCRECNTMKRNYSLEELDHRSRQIIDGMKSILKGYK